MKILQTLLLIGALALAACEPHESWEEVRVNPKYSGSITVYSTDGKVIKEYQSLGRINRSYTNCSFVDKETGNQITVTGNFIITEK